MEKRLIAAIIIQAIKDWQKPRFQPELEEFLGSSWFAILSEAIELDQENLRLKLLTGQVEVKEIRAAYRSKKIP